MYTYFVPIKLCLNCTFFRYESFENIFFFFFFFFFVCKSLERNRQSSDIEYFDQEMVHPPRLLECRYYY